MKFFYVYMITINLIGFFIMAYDKRKAIKHEWRIKEATLMLIAFAFGGVGVLLGMITFHHKTKHLKFTLGVPIFILIQVYIIFNFLNF